MRGSGSAPPDRPPPSSFASFGLETRPPGTGVDRERPGDLSAPPGRGLPSAPSGLSADVEPFGGGAHRRGGAAAGPFESAPGPRRATDPWRPSTEAASWGGRPSEASAEEASWGGRPSASEASEADAARDAMPFGFGARGGAGAGEGVDAAGRPASRSSRYPPPTDAAAPRLWAPGDSLEPWAETHALESTFPEYFGDDGGRQGGGVGLGGLRSSASEALLRSAPGSSGALAPSPSSFPDVDRSRVLSRVRVHLVGWLLTFAIVSYLDRNNLAFGAAQMTADLGMSCSAYGTGAGAFYVGYAAFQIPMSLAMMRVGAAAWLGATCALWGALAASLSLVRTSTAFLLVRFFLGALESSAYPGMWHHLGLFFSPKEMTTAFPLVSAANAFSSVIGAPIAALIVQLDGAWGLRGWQWLFLVEGGAAVVFGALLATFLARSPSRSRFLEPRERQWLQARQDAAALRAAAELERSAGPGTGAGAVTGGGASASSARARSERQTLLGGKSPSDGALGPPSPRKRPGGGGGGGDDDDDAPRPPIASPASSRTLPDQALPSALNSPARDDETLSLTFGEASPSPATSRGARSSGSGLGNADRGSSALSSPDGRGPGADGAAPPGSGPGSAAPKQSGLRSLARVGRDWRVLYLSFVWCLVGCVMYGLMLWMPLMVGALVSSEEGRAGGSGAPDAAEAAAGIGSPGSGASPLGNGVPDAVAAAVGRRLLEAIEKHSPSPSPFSPSPPPASAGCGSGQSEANAGVFLLTAIPYALATAAMILGGRVSERRNERRFHSAVPLLVSGVALAGAAAFAAGAGGASSGAALSSSAAISVPSAHPIASFVCLTLSIGSVWGFFGPFFSWPAQFLSRADAAVAYTVINTFGSVGGFLGPTLIGIAAQATGSYAAAMAMLAGLLIVAGTMLALLRAPHRHAEDDADESAGQGGAAARAADGPHGVQEPAGYDRI